MQRTEVVEAARPATIPDGVLIDGEFWLQLIWDLQIEAERNNSHKDYSCQYICIKRHHPSDHRPNSLESLGPFRCVKCGYFHSHNYVIGKKPVRCF